jgi:cytochrome c biogenesis protein ResB
MAIACIAGSVIASNEKLGVDYGREYVFHTWWFIGLMGLLLVNLCLCSWEKSYIALTLYRKKNIISTPTFYKKAAHGISGPWTGSVDDVEQFLRKRYTIVHRAGNAIYAQKGLFGRCGATIIHIGLLWTMAAGYYRILADDMGWGVYDSTVILPEGQTTQSYFARIDRLKGPTQENLREKTMPFALRALDFTADYYPHSTVARRFASLIELHDGDRSEIHEVTMTNPLVYGGYKITQNSFSANERVTRGKFRVEDTQSGDAVELDAAPGDPVRLRLPHVEDLFFQVDGMDVNAKYHVLNLAARTEVESGEVTADTAEGPLPVDLSQFQKSLRTSKYSFLVAALFPNFTFDENRQPTTKDEKFENPAILVMVFKNGKPNGYTWLFSNAEAQKIVGQTHPELEMFFTEFRKAAGASGSQGLYDYEVHVELKEKANGKPLGQYWVKPGEVTELPGVSDALLSAPNVTTETSSSMHAQEAVSDGTTSSTRVTSATIAGGAAPGPAPGGGSDSATTSATVAGKQPGRFLVTVLGTTTGNVTFLGFMKDPSVSWIFSGCIVIIAGTLIAFLLVYREVWVYYDSGERMLYMATVVRGTSPSAHREFDRHAAQIASMRGSPEEA